jgi:hypothetical protein
VVWGDMDWIGHRNMWRALVNSVLNLRVPWNAGKLSNGLTSSGLSSSAQLHRDSLAATFSFKKLLNCTHEAEWTPFQTHYFSENLVVPGIEPEASGSVARNSDH